MITRSFVAVAIAGLAVSAGVAWWGGLGGTDASVLLAWGVGGAAFAGTAAALVLRSLRSPRAATQAVVAALAPVLAVAVGVWGAADAMFISAHDLHALLVVLVGAGTLGVVTALAVGRRVAVASTSLGHLANRIGRDGADGQHRAMGHRVAMGTPDELVDLGAQLEAALARLDESRQQAAAVEKSRREIVAWVSHDLRTPLAGIRAMADALEDGLVDDPATVARYHHTMRNEIDRLAGLVDDLFELSRINTGAVTLDLEQVPLDALVSDAVAGVAVAADAKGIDLHDRIGAPSPVVELSIPEMARVVRNLLDNAIRHTPRGGTVRVEAAVDPAGDALVSVCDGCGGIPAPELPRVFDLAYGGHAGRTAGGADAGTGLGLAVARGLVEAHHGEISVANDDDGCRFTIRLPLVANGQSQPPQAASNS